MLVPHCLKTSFIFVKVNVFNYLVDKKKKIKMCFNSEFKLIITFSIEEVYSSNSFELHFECMFQ